MYFACVPLLMSTAGTHSTTSWVREAKQSVTAVEFSRDGDVLVTGGAADGVVKFWDRRVLGKAVKCVDCHAVSGDATAAPRPHGIGAIAIDRSGSSIAVSCVDRCEIRLPNEYSPKSLTRTKRRGRSLRFRVKTNAVQILYAFLLYVWDDLPAAQYTYLIYSAMHRSADYRATATARFT